jgi:hypothetical protein
MMASFPVEDFSPSRVPVSSNQFGGIYPTIANTQNPSNLPRGALEIPKVTLDDMTSVDVNNFMQLSVSKGIHPFDNSYSTHPPDFQTFLFMLKIYRQYQPSRLLWYHGPKYLLPSEPSQSRLDNSINSLGVSSQWRDLQSPVSDS